MDEALRHLRPLMGGLRRGGPAIGVEAHSPALLKSREHPVNCGLFRDVGHSASRGSFCGAQATGELQLLLSISARRASFRHAAPHSGKGRRGRERACGFPVSAAFLYDGGV